MSRAAILSIGAELMLGQIADTNAAWIAAELLRHGWEVDEIRGVGDDRDRIVSAIRALAATHAALILTGGLGPTEDDLTRQALADAAGVGLAESAELVEQIRARFAAIQRPMIERNRVQALLPAGAEGIRNPAGTAPGIALSLGCCRCFAMPGVPSEMRRMLAEGVLPRLGRPAGRAALVREFHCWGIGEGNLAERISGLLARGRNPEVGTRVADSIVTVRVHAAAANEEAARELLERDEAELRNRLGDCLVGLDAEGLPEAVVRLLREKARTVALAESCTGGMLGALLTSAPGSSEVFREGVIAYANEVKSRRLGVSPALLAAHGAVSEPVARAMAGGVARAAESDYGIGITGVAGPGGGTEEKPVGTVHIAVAGPAETRHRAFRFALDREGNRRRAAFAALGMLWEMVR